MEIPIKNKLSLRQRVRKTLIIFSFVLLPVTFAYISCPIIKEGVSQGIVPGGLIVFILVFVSSLFFGRLWCGWLCPAGGLQEIYFQINDKTINIPKLKLLKYLAFLYFIFIPIISAFYSAGGLKTIDFFYYTDHGISIAKPGAYVVLFVQVFFITIFAMFAGKRGFCHYFCPIGVIPTIGRNIRNLLHFPALHLSADVDQCINCKKCSKICPMGLDVNSMLQQKNMENNDCILCGDCVDACPMKAIHFTLTEKAIHKRIR